MIELLNKFYCNECESGWNYGLDVKGIKEMSLEKNLFNQNIKCESCGNEFLYFQGLINKLVEDDHFGTWEFIYDTQYFGSTNIVVGKEHKITLPKQVLITKVMLTCQDGFCSVAPNFHSQIESDSFGIVSSETDDEGEMVKKFGENLSVNWMVYGKSGNKPIETWVHLLTQVKEQIVHGQYNIAVLCSEMMFESFLDSTLNKLLISKGLSDGASYVILERLGNIQSKAHELLKELNGVGLQGEGKGTNPINTQWTKLVKLRNKIAHGDNVDLDKEKAKWALRTSLDAIFFIYNSCPLYK
ncbi:hypothetical protein [Peribacillus sp. AS_2]|uniref:hypothetical protein n=1 Tax=Peribacillus sp. AS_2 TaxID=2996755 RepID=UPI0022A69B88|nr:hypothetical protein [Peribacillus sp. AS_2]MCZ0872748.1 hypothetical protein [Peribacillus sp. AS_2]